MTIGNEQFDICKKYECNPHEFNPTMNVGVNLASLKEQPIYGVRIHPTADSSGWYFWGGNYSENEDFFQAVYGFHVLRMIPMINKYLALQPGYKLIIDNEGYEDVWYDPSAFVRAGQKS